MTLQIPHLSCYALTVEPKTALENFIEKGILPPVEDAIAEEHHRILIEKTEALGYLNYEFSNFCIPGWESQNNSAYWQGKSYLGIGPSAHSYDGATRSWNVANNTLYLKSIAKEELPLEREILSKVDQYNEFVMTRLRTANGISLQEVTSLFGASFLMYLEKQMAQYITKQLLMVDGEFVKVTKRGKFLTDGISSDLFMLGP